MSLKSLRCLSFVFLFSFFEPHAAIGSTTTSEHGKKALDLYTHYSAEASQLADEERRKKLQAIIAEGEKGVAKNDRLAMALVGVFLQADLQIGGEIISPMNRDRAFALLKKSYDMGEIEASHGLVKAYANGWGVQRDRTLAKTLVHEAISKGCTDCEPLRRDLERGSGPLLEFYPEQAAGCSMPTDKKRKYENVAVPCSNGTFSGYGSMTYTEGNSQRKCVLTGDFSNGLLEGQGTSVCGNYTYRGGFAKGKRSGLGTLDGPDGFHAEGRYANDHLNNGFQLSKNEYGVRVGYFYVNGSNAGICTEDYNSRYDVNCSEANRKLIYPQAVAAREAQKVAQLETQKGPQPTGQVLAPPINCADFAYSKTTATPTASSGQNALCISIRDKIGSSQFRFLSFQKIDGLSSVVNGVNIYKMQYEAEIEYTADLRPECFEKMAFMKYPQCSETLSWGGISARGNALPTVAPAGAKIRRRGDIVFTKFESGWRWSKPSGLDY